MKRGVVYYLFSLTIIFTLACNLTRQGSRKNSKSSSKDNIENSIYTHSIDMQQSKLHWKGSKFTGDSHSGIIEINKGGLILNDNIVSSGYFEINMNSIKVTW